MKTRGHYILTLFRDMHLRPVMILVLMCIVIILIGGIFLFFAHRSFLDKEFPQNTVHARISAQQSQSNFSQIRTHWVERMGEVGSQRAYEELKGDYAQRRFEDQHAAAHIFGELLYEKEGTNGVIFCDESFDSGCSHGFFGTALSRQGVAKIKEFDRACIKKFGAGSVCQHGIGHGLMEYFGRDNFLAALRGCEQTTQKNPLHGCSAGVFMAYNIPIRFSDDSVNTNTIRTLNKDNPHEPCNTIVPEHFRSSCYFEMAQWWKNVLGEDYGKMGRLCMQVYNKGQKESCYLGIGRIVTSSNEYDIAATIASCKKMSEAEGELYCRVGGAMRFLAIESYRAVAFSLCAYTDASRKNECQHLLMSEYKPSNL